jgi:hypothetical protein
VAEDVSSVLFSSASAGRTLRKKQQIFISLRVNRQPHSGWLGFSAEALRRRKKQKHNRVSKVAFATACLARGLNKESKEVIQSGEWG